MDFQIIEVHKTNGQVQFHLVVFFEDDTSHNFGYFNSHAKAIEKFNQIRKEREVN